jgi:hypothetical protein
MSNSLGHGRADPSPLIRSFERSPRAGNRSERTITAYLVGLRQAAAFLRARGPRSRPPLGPTWKRSWPTCSPAGPKHCRQLHRHLQLSAVGALEGAGRYCT